MTATGNYVADNSTLANFSSWAQAISSAFATLGWVRGNDTGQVVWTATVLTLTQVASASGSSVYSYSGFTGPAPRVGMSVIITGFATGGNNVTANLTAVSGSTVTTATTTQGNETHAASGTTTAIAAVPASTYVYEIWAAADTQASTLPIVVKIGYGNSTSQVGIQVTVGTSSNGAGTITGALSLNAQVITGNPFTTFATQGATTYPCYFSGDAGEFRMLMWVTNATSGVTTMFAIERSKDATGAKTAEYFTALSLASQTSTGTGVGRQQTTVSTSTAVGQENGIICCVVQTAGSGGSAFFGGTVAAFPVFPVLGKVGNPMLGLMACIAGDVADNTSVTVTSMYGGAHTYMACKTVANGGFQLFGRAAATPNSSALLMRYE